MASARVHPKPRLMITLVASPEILVAPSAAQLEAARAVMLGALLRRGVSRPDADDAVQRVLERIPRHPALVAKLGALDDHAGYFVRAAYTEHLMALRAEAARRGREECYFERHPTGATGDDVDHCRIRDALELAAVVDLTARQRWYLRAVLVEGHSIQQLADMSGTSTAAVGAVLSRAASTMREHLVQTRDDVGEDDGATNPADGSSAHRARTTAGRRRAQPAAAPE